MLKKAGATVELAENGKIGFEMASSAMQKGQPFDLVIMDWKMPGMDGIEASRQILEHPKLDSPPAIIMVTAIEPRKIKLKWPRTVVNRAKISRWCENFARETMTP